MPVPKRKTSKARRDQRSSTKFIRPQSIAECGNCTKPLAPHTACYECGFYKGTKVLRTKGERTLTRSETLRAKEAQAAPEEKKEEE